MEYRAQNYNQLAPQVYQDLRLNGVRSTSRNGDTLRLPGVNVLTVYRPWERVNFSQVRDANPFFHLMEAMAMLVSFNSAPFLAHFAKNMLAFSDDGKTFNGFYGERIRTTWGDQLAAVVKELREKPDSRQAVIQIWDPADLCKQTKDKACNTQLMFSLENGVLRMTSINRSNDAIWGTLTGANVVHFSFFHEYVACALDVAMGEWSHVSNNLHVYVDNPKWAALSIDPFTHDLYGGPFQMGHVPLFTGPAESFDIRLRLLVEQFDRCVREGTLCGDSACVREYPFLLDTVVPVFNTWQLHKMGREQEAMATAQFIQAKDWQVACRLWLRRRYEKKEVAS